MATYQCKVVCRSCKKAYAEYPLPDTLVPRIADVEGLCAECGNAIYLSPDPADECLVIESNHDI